MKPAPILSDRFLYIEVWLCLILFSCNSTDAKKPVEPGELTFVSSHELDVKDPSGLALDVSGNFLWTVSDIEDGRVYKISFEGKIIDYLLYRGDDMEGIAMNPNDMTLWIVEERLMQIIQLDSIGRVLQVVDVPKMNDIDNDGLEGISINPVNNHIFLLHEKNPRVFLELNSDMQIIRDVPINFNPPYTLLDLSGLFYDHVQEEFWIVSDESMRIVVTDFDLNPIRTYVLGRSKFEGITVNSDIRRIYLVNDEEDRLYIYDY